MHMYAMATAVDTDRPAAQHEPEGHTEFRAITPTVHQLRDGSCHSWTANPVEFRGISHKPLSNTPRPPCKVDDASQPQVGHKGHEEEAREQPRAA